MRFFPALIVAGFAVFLVLQIWIVQTTGASIRRYQAASQGRGDSGFRLTVGREVFLTALPIAFTVAVAIASYGWWQRLAAPN